VEECDWFVICRINCWPYCVFAEKMFTWVRPCKLCDSAFDETYEVKAVFVDIDFFFLLQLSLNFYLGIPNLSSFAPTILF
jgi:hypothetical protein